MIIFQTAKHTQSCRPPSAALFNRYSHPVPILRQALDYSQHGTSRRGIQLRPNGVQQMKFADDLEVGIGLIATLTILPLPVRCQPLLRYTKPLVF